MITLYGLDISTYCARVRITIASKVSRSHSYHRQTVVPMRIALVPMGTIPGFVDGDVVPANQTLSSNI